MSCQTCMVALGGWGLGGRRNVPAPPRSGPRGGGGRHTSYASLCGAALKLKRLFFPMPHMHRRPLLEAANPLGWILWLRKHNPTVREEYLVLLLLLLFKYVRPHLLLVTSILLSITLRRHNIQNSCFIPWLALSAIWYGWVACRRRRFGLLFAMEGAGAGCDGGCSGRRFCRASG